MADQTTTTGSKPSSDHPKPTTTGEGKDPYLAKPSGECCLQGHLHTGTPRGSFTTVNDIETYVSSPPEGKANGHILLYFADVYGMFTNGLLVMDSFAEAGYLVLGLDYFRGDPVYKHRAPDKSSLPGFDFEAWKDKHMAFADVAVPPWIAAVKARFGSPATKYACVGYCFGAPYVCDALASTSGPPACVAGAFAHPAFLKERHFRNLASPLYLSCAEVDHTFGTEDRNKAVDMMIADGKRYHVQLFQGVAHGFALRGDMEVPYERWVKERSLEGIVKWFDFWLGQ